jgi:hypothetical protein
MKMNAGIFFSRESIAETAGIVAETVCRRLQKAKLAVKSTTKRNIHLEYRP